MSNIASNTISVLGGAAIGAIAAYLLDPDHGIERRQQIADRASDAVSSASDVVRSRASDAAGSAKSLAGSISDYAHQLADHVSSHAANASGQARDAADQAHQDLSSSVQSLLTKAKAYTNQLSDQGSARADDLSHRAKSTVSRHTGWEPSNSGPGATGITAGAVGTLALGAGLMYFLDPTRGHSRRAWAEDKLFSWVRRGTRSTTRYGRHVGNQLQGVASKVKAAVPEQWAGAVDKVTDTVKNAAENVQSNANPS